MSYIGGQTHTVSNNHKLPLIPVPDRKLKLITCNRVEHFRFPGVRCDIWLCKKFAENNNEGVVNKVIKFTDKNYKPQASPLLQSPVERPCSSPICHNDTDSDSDSDSNDNSDSEDKNYGTENILLNCQWWQCG